MIKLKIYSLDGQDVGDFDFEESLLVRDRGSDVLNRAVIAFRAAQRAGTASTLSKGQVAGSNKKPWRQKGTGRARAGYRQSPVWRGGGVAFGPKPRDYRQKMNKKAARLAFRRAFTERLVSGDVKVFEKLELPDSKTKSFLKVLKSLGVEAPVLVVLPTLRKDVEMASRNLKGVEVTSVAQVNSYQLVRYPKVVMDKAGIMQMTERLKKSGGTANEV